MATWRPGEDANDPRRAASVAAARALQRDLAGVDLRRHLDDAFARLNATDWQVSFADDVGANSGARRWSWVSTRLIVQTDYPRWGGFEHDLEDVPLEIAESIVDHGTDPVLWLDDVLRFPSYPVKLHEWPGWAGPVYTVHGDGNHRVHSARALGVPYLPCLLSTQGPTSPVDDVGVAHQELSRAAREALAAGLQRRGLATVDGPRISPRAGWMLARPTESFLALLRYESLYPGAVARCGIPTTALESPGSWWSWLAEDSRPRRRLRRELLARRTQ